MTSKKEKQVEFRFYDMPGRDPCLVFSGEAWRRVYGEGAPCLHFHNVLEVGYCHEGRGRMVYDGEERNYHAGMISVIPGHVLHNTCNAEGEFSLWSYVFFEPHTYLARFFGDDPRFVENVEKRLNCRYILEAAEEQTVLAGAVRTILDARKAGMPYEREIVSASLVQIILAAAGMNRDYDSEITGPGPLRRDAEIRRTLTYIESHCAEPLSVGDLAREAGLSEPHYRRIFREAMDMPPSDYLNMVRIQKACSMLVGTDYPVDLIAEKAGFTTLSTFNRNFRRFMNEAPLRWKKAHIGSDDQTGIRIRARSGWTDTIR